ncbi:MAG TPA: SulP family inorganic anion transporter [Blastocatellia bacterium]|nr:SulP family inorganic anion transporter [Blastocatellia bacterium]HMX29672.1 SulP family inorganic anion transporter [Blastocatellia bacterium]HMY73127.1 SulP family inorganic anion transporter [Blastocatellia bacterium]HNG31709.1 SulP family inorganic anion transporter [Blastocatellia bacterium]
MSELSGFRPGMFNNLKEDLPAGLVVFLVALPLCLGIALASGAPLFSGVIAGIIGGLMVALLSGSEVSVSGPAAGLAVIVAAAIQNLGSFRVFLLAVALSGVIQIALGFLRAGVIGNYVPNAVIKGMLAAIGVVIILKQIPHALGRDQNFEGDFDFFFEMDKKSNTLTDILSAIYTASPAAVVITIISLGILLLWEKPFMQRYKIFKLIPGALVVVILGVLLNAAFRMVSPDFPLKVEDGHLVTLPVSDGLGGFFQQFTLPDWSALTNKQVYITALTIAIVGSIESLLSLEAADKLDPLRRISSTNKELKAQGVGNLISGLVGGLPITAVIVRSTANVYAGARTRLSALTHGVLLFVCVLLIPNLLNYIPLCSLAAILFVIGYKLTKPELYRKMYEAGLNQFLPFIVTVLAIVFTDLLTGVLIGIVFGVFFVIRTNHHSALTLVNQDNYYLIRFNKDASFVNKTELKDKLLRIPPDSKLIIDGTKAGFIDNDIYDVVTDFLESARYRKIDVELKNFSSKAQSYRRRTTDGKLQKAIAG